MKGFKVRKVLLMMMTAMLVVTGVFTLGGVDAEAATVKGPTKFELTKTSVSLNIGDTATIKIKSATGNKTAAKYYTFTSENKNYATVDKNGKVTAVKGNSSGKTVKITVKSSGQKVSKTYKVTIYSGPATITLKNGNSNLSVGDTLDLAVKSVTPNKTNVDKKATYTSSDSSVASVDKNGKVTAKKAGKATITATARYINKSKANATKTVKVYVYDGPSKIDVGVDTLKMAIAQKDGSYDEKEPGAIYLIRKSFAPKGADTAVTYQSLDKRVAVIDDNGLIKALKTGETTITVTAQKEGKNGKVGEGQKETATIKVKVVNSPQAVPAKETSADNPVYVTLNSSVEQFPLQEGNVDDYDLEFTSANTNVATVDAKGIVSGAGMGDTVIVAQSQSNRMAWALCYVKVEDAPKSIAVEAAPENGLNPGKGLENTAQIVLKDKDAGLKSAHAYDVTYTSSDTAIATVNKNTGLVTAGNKAGTAKITVTAKSANSTGKKASATYSVDVKVGPTSFAKGSFETKIYNGKSTTAKLKSFTTVVSGGTASQNVKYTSSDESVATVKANSSTITGKGRGTATITVTSTVPYAKVDGVEQYAAPVAFDITVKQQVTGIQVPTTTSSKPLVIAKGKTLQLKPVVTPNNANDKTVTYKSSKTSVATVSSTGKITAKANGSAYITIKSNDEQKSVKLYVKVQSSGITNVTKVALSPTSKSLSVGKTATLKATVTPSKATNKTVAWSTSKPTVATVDAKGKVTATGIGEATITALATDGSGKKATCKVTVTSGISSFKINGDATVTKYAKDGSFTLTTAVTPKDAKIEAKTSAVTWTATPLDYETYGTISVDANGLVSWSVDPAAYNAPNASISAEITASVKELQDGTANTLTKSVTVNVIINDNQNAFVEEGGAYKVVLDKNATSYGIIISRGDEANGARTVALEDILADVQAVCAKNEAFNMEQIIARWDAMDEDELLAILKQSKTLNEYWSTLESKGLNNIDVETTEAEGVVTKTITVPATEGRKAQTVTIAHTALTEGKKVDVTITSSVKDSTIEITDLSLVNEGTTYTVTGKVNGEALTMTAVLSEDKTTVASLKVVDDSSNEVLTYADYALSMNKTYANKLLTKLDANLTVNGSAVRSEENAARNISIVFFNCYD